MSRSTRNNYAASRNTSSDNRSLRERMSRDLLVVVGAAAELGLVEQGLDLLQLLQHGVAVLGELGRARIECRAKGRSE